MASKYTRSNLRSMQSQYVDDQSVNVAKILRERYDKGLEKKTLLEQAMGALQVGDGDQYLLNNAKNDISNQLAKHANSGDWENSGVTIDAATTGLVSNRGVQLAQQSYQNREKEQADIAKLRLEKGVSHVIDFNALYDDQGNVVGHKFDNHQSYTEDAEGNMVSNVYKADSQIQLDYDARKQNVLKGLAKDGSALGPSQIVGLLERWSGVGSGKADKAAVDLVDSYIYGTDEGRQELRSLTELGGYTEEEAEEIIVESMKAVASKQVGMLPSYMTAPAGQSPATPFGNGLRAPGAVVLDENLDPITVQNEVYGKLLGQYRDEKDPDKKQSLLLELNSAEVTRNKTIKLTMSDLGHDENVKARENLWKGANSKFQLLESLLMETSKSSWGMDRSNPLISAIKTGNEAEDLDGKYGIAGGTDVTSSTFSNVSDLALSQKNERKSLQAQFSDIGILNSHFGTSYTQGDVPQLQKLAGQYYDFMKGRGEYEDVANGDDFYKAYSKTPVKMDDAIIFNAQGTKEATAVNATLASMSLEQFNVFGADGENLSSDELDVIQKATAAEPRLIFGGLILPDVFSGTRASMVLKIDGKPYRAVSKGDTGGGMGLMSNIANVMGMDIWKGNVDAYNEAASGELTLGEYHSKKTEAIGLGYIRRLNPQMATALQSNPEEFDTKEWNLTPQQEQDINRTQLGVIQLENLILAGVGRLIKLGDTKELRAISNDPNHVRYEEFSQALKQYRAQQFKVTDY